MTGLWVFSPVLIPELHYAIVQRNDYYLCFASSLCVSVAGALLQTQTTGHSENVRLLITVGVDY